MHDHDEHNQEQDYDKHAGHSVNMFRSKFWVCLALTIPVLLYSENVARWLHISPPSFPGSMYVPFVLSSVIFFYGGWVFIKGAISELKNRLPGMMTLISLAIITSYVYSLATVFGLRGEGFFWELATLVTMMLLCHWLEMASVAKAERAIASISTLLPANCARVSTLQSRWRSHNWSLPGANARAVLRAAYLPDRLL